MPTLGRFLKFGPVSTDPLMTFGTGSPEGVVTAPPGSTYYDKNGGQWEKGRGTGNTGWYQTDNIGGQMNSTNWFWLPHTGVSTRIFSADGDLQFAPWYVSWPITVDAIGIEVTTVGAAGSVIRIGIWAEGSNGLPGTLLKDCGTVSGLAVAGVATSTGQAITLSPGWYFLGAASQGAPATRPTIRTVTQSFMNKPLNSGSTTVGASSGAFQSLQATGVTGAFASTPTATLAAQNVPRFQIKPLSVP